MLQVGALLESVQLAKRFQNLDEIKEVSSAMVRQYAPAISPISTSSGDLVPLDMDVSPFDNSKTQKEGVSRTYKTMMAMHR